MEEKNQQAFFYMLLSRCKQDCLYYLGHGNRHNKHLFYWDVKKHINKMRELYNILNEKPEWLTLEQINQFERDMLTK